MKKYLIWGFLGSGKTTFISYLLSNVFVNQRVVVLENESGESSIDAVLLRGRNFDVVSLHSGCICCTLRNDLMQTIDYVQKSLNPDILLLEPSGLSSLTDLLSIPNCWFDKVITLLDIHQMDFLMKINRVYYQRQFALASVIILTKLENELPQRITMVCEELLKLNPNTIIIDRPYSTLPVQTINGLFDTVGDKLQMVASLLSKISSPQYIVENYKLRKNVSKGLLVSFLKKCVLSSRKLVRAKGICCDIESRYWLINYDLNSFNVNELKQYSDLKREDCFLSLWWENEFSTSEENSHIIPITDLKFDNKELYETLGYRDTIPDDYILTFINKLKEDVFSICSPKFGYRLLDGAVLGTSVLIVGNQLLTPNHIITQALTGCESFYLLIASVGKEVDEWILAKRNGSDIMEAWIADALGSVLAEAIVEAGNTKLEQMARINGMYTTNSYSPGYCGWNVNEQQRLFSMFPEGFCGVTLTESSLMLPIKSVSALVGVGVNVEKVSYKCDICTKKDCYKRRY